MPPRGGISRKRLELRAGREQLRISPKRPALLSAKRALRLHEGNEADRNKDKCSGDAAAMPFLWQYWQCLISGRLFFRLCVNSTCFAFFRDLLRLFYDRPCPTYSWSPMLGVPLLCCLLRVSYSLFQSSMPFVFASMCIFSCFLVPWITSGLSFRI